MVYKDETGTENVEQTSGTRIEAPAPEHSAPVETATATEDVAPVEDTAHVEPAATSPQPVTVSEQKIEPNEFVASHEDAVIQASIASAERLSERGSGLVEAVATTTDAETGEDDEAVMQPAPRIESGCRLDRNVLLASLQQVQNYLQQTDVQEQTDDVFLGRLGEMVRVLNADMTNLRAYCERAQTQLESIRSPIKDITDKIFKTIPAREEESEARE